jgi:pimeloyl-ACP methyl ester carboxylesterase
LSESTNAVSSGRSGREPLLLLDGLDDGAVAWAAQLPLLEGERRVVRCTSHAGTVAERVDEARATLDALGVERAHVLGASLGSAVALRFAGEHPERVRTLTVSGSWARADRALRAVLTSWLWSVEHAGAIEDVLHQVHTGTRSAASWNAGVVDDEIVHAASGRDGEWPAFRRRAELLLRSALHHDVVDALPHATAPALVLVGEADPLTPVRHAREVAALLPDGRLEVVADAGHEPPRDQPRAVAELLLPFLATHEPARAGAALAR